MATGLQTGDASVQLSHEGVWDDSALIDSWNEALEEYKKYHSIKATGEDPDQVIKAALEAEESEARMRSAAAAPQEPLETEKPDAADAPEHEYDPEVVAEERGLVAEGMEKRPAGPSEDVHESSMPEPPSFGSTQDTGVRTDPQLAPTFPNLGEHDESLKSLMMAWYWAGYYTGLHVGQQKTRDRQPPTG